MSEQPKSLQEQVDMVRDAIADLLKSINDLRVSVGILDTRTIGMVRLGPDAIENRFGLVLVPDGDQVPAGVVLQLPAPAEPPPVDRSNRCTTNGKPVDEVLASQTNETGQHAGYVILCAEERAKGFVRPYRDRYQHVGIRPKYLTRALLPSESATYAGSGYVQFEEYPDGSDEKLRCLIGRYWTHAELESGCDTVTTMSRDLSETYARDPKFYGSTYCVGCRRHMPVAEFVWTSDGQRVGS